MHASVCICLPHSVVQSETRTLNKLIVDELVEAAGTRGCHRCAAALIFASVRRCMRENALEVHLPHARKKTGQNCFLSI